MSILTDGKKAEKILAVISNLPRAVALIWQAGKGWVIAQFFLLVLRGVLPAVIIYLTKLFVDALVAAIRDPDRSGNISALIRIGGIFAFVTIVNELLNSFIQMIYATHAEKLQAYIFALIHEKSINADLSFYEQPEFFDHLHRARSEARNRPAGLTAQIGSLLQNSITFAAMGAVLIRFGLWLPLVLLISALPAFYVFLQHTLKLHTWQRKKTVEERRLWYHDWLLTSSETAAEIRLFELGGHFREKFDKLKEKLRKERLKLALNQRISELLASLIALILTALAFLWIIWRTIGGTGTLGDLALFYQAFNQGQSLARTFLQDAGNLYANSLFIGNLFEFLELEPEIKDSPDPLPAPETLTAGISFENVTFGYRTSENFILKDFNLFIPANKIVAVVGENGAGKSTLIKLICRFYDPQAGIVSFDKIDVKNFSLKELRRKITVLFQTPVHYNKTIAENIKFGNVEADFDLEEIKAAAKSSGADRTIEKFSKNYDQVLGHWFPEGTELSVGEWQRIALARAILRQAPIILLDEPTSAMDPWAETDWLKRFVKTADGKTVVIITHKFTTAMYADLIYVMRNGKIVESGSHTELLSKRGIYHQSWQEQNKLS